MGFNEYLKKTIVAEATKTVQRLLPLQTSLPNTGGCEVTEFNAETGLITVRLDNGRIVEGVNPGSKPVGPGSTGVLAGGMKFIS